MLKLWVSAVISRGLAFVSFLQPLPGASGCPRPACGGCKLPPACQTLGAVRIPCRERQSFHPVSTFWTFLLPPLLMILAFPNCFALLIPLGFKQTNPHPPPSGSTVGWRELYIFNNTLNPHLFLFFSHAANF